ncbi:MAG: DUF1501 domain-containing protein, partial [Planctomycetaceae bacterium]
MSIEQALPTENASSALHRRRWLKEAGGGFGGLALASLLGQEGLLAERRTYARGPLSPKPPQFAPKATSVIFLFMYGGPSQIDTFDPKPELERWHGRDLPVFNREDAFMGDTKATAMKSPFGFAKHGAAGIDICDEFPELSTVADELCVIRSMHCKSNNHGPALMQMQSGSIRSGHPSMGAWAGYGLGGECQDLPGFVVMLDYQGAPVNGGLNWSNGFLPASYQGVPLRSTGEPIAYVQPPKGVSHARQRLQLDLLAKWNQQYADANPVEEALAARISAYELAFRMQTKAPEAVDISQESKAIQQAYGIDRKVTRHFGTNCLLARRLVERGVRFIQLYSGGNDGPSAWDAHDKLEQNHRRHCLET